jgi:hypothetical protein
MGLVMEPEHGFSYAKDYTYIEIPVLGFWNQAEEKLVDKVLRNQYVRVIPACSIDCRGSYKIQVEPNPAIAEYGLAQGTYYVSPDSGKQTPGFYFHARKDLEIADLPFAVRLYMRG